MPHNTLHGALHTAVMHYFLEQEPTSQSAEQKLQCIEHMLCSDTQESMAQCVAVLRAANTFLDADARQLADILAQRGQPVLCAAGCTGCCRQLVLCQPFEAENIGLYLAEHPQKVQRFRAAYALWDAATAAYRASYLRWAEGYYARGEDDGSHQLADFQAPCPFLEQNEQGEGLCAIYAARPYGCRTCVAVDPACASPEHHGTRQMQFTLYTGHHAKRTALNAVLLKRLGGTRKMAALPDAVAALLK